ncbi:uncharacterized protein [Clytia hemisphaerica]|uniref:Uncharacterized protein n=1 Tax=Clytia hemisphaerica TaxID=252671 RepID=A0A7M5XGV3_9CNID
MNDWKLILKGSLGIAASFLYFTGPWGTVATALLPLLDVIFKLTDQTVPKTEESEEEIIDRVVSAAIERAKLQDFKMELAGVRHHYTTLSGVTSAYRSTGNEITKEQANVLYNHVFDELVIFGKLASLIESKCSLPLDEKVIRVIYDCLAFVDLYSELSTLRKLVLLDIASLMKNQYGKTADNIIEMYRKEFETDAELLRFLIDPINYPMSRLIVASFYQQRHRHETTDFLLDVLATVFPHTRFFFYKNNFYKNIRVRFRV